MQPDWYPQRIVCLTEEPTEILYRLGEQDRIVGISGFTVRPARARKEKPRVSAFTEADIPAIVSLKPDLVIGFSDIQADIAQSLIRQGVTVLINNHRSVEEILKTILQIGALVGKSSEAMDLARQYRRSLEARQKVNAGRVLKPRVYFEEWYDPIITGIRWVSELVQAAGGEDVYAHHRTASLAKDRIVADPGEVVNLNPDLIVVSWCGKKFKPERIRQRPGWATMKAVQEGHLYEIPSSMILQPGPGALSDGFDRLCEIVDGWYRKVRIFESL
jgi:iron complex transport system substrate-binding protein